MSAAEIVQLWDLASDDRLTAAHLLLRKARPDLGDDGIDDLTVGGRAAWLLELRRATFGETVKGLVCCPACSQRLTLSVDSRLLRRQPASVDDAGSRPVVTQIGAVQVEARIPDGRAILAAALCPDVDSARAALIEHCVVRAWTSSGTIAAEVLPDEVLVEVGEALMATDPQSEVRLGALCAGCGHHWIAVFEIESFLWIEVAALALRLLDEVHSLAAGYGWTEEQILDLSSRRRHYYVERVAGG